MSKFFRLTMIRSAPPLSNPERTEGEKGKTLCNICLGAIQVLRHHDFDLF